MLCVAIAFGRKIRNRQADDCAEQDRQRRNRDPIHVASPLLNRIPPANATTAITTLETVIEKLNGLFSTNWSSNGNTAHSALTSMSHSDTAWKRACRSFMSSHFKAFDVPGIVES